MDTKRESLMEMLDKKLRGYGRIDLKDKTTRKLLLREIELTIKKYWQKRREREKG